MLFLGVTVGALVRRFWCRLFHFPHTSVQTAGRDRSRSISKATTLCVAPCMFIFFVCLFLFVSQFACCLFVCFCVSLFVGLNVCLFVCLLAGWLVVHHDLFSQNNSDCHLHKETLVCSKFEVGLMKILSLACNLAFYNCLVVPSSSDQKCLVVPSLRSRSTIPFVS